MFQWLKKVFTEDPMKKKEEVHMGKTRVLVKYNVGFENNLYIRGNGGGLSWERGVLLKNVSPDEWIWEPSAPVTDCEFKVLINDVKYETGENHHVGGGKIVQYTPKFP